MAANPELDLDLEDLPPKTLRKMLRAMMQKMCRKPGDDVDPADEDESEKAREDLADLHEEKKGPGPKQAVSKDDLPFEVDAEDPDDPSEAEEEESESPPKKKRG